MTSQGVGHESARALTGGSGVNGLILPLETVEDVHVAKRSRQARYPPNIILTSVPGVPGGPIAPCGPVSPYMETKTIRL